MPGILCEHCTAVCCRYIAIPLDTPETRRDFDDLRWFLIHESISIFVEDGDWYICLQTPCRHLQADHRCGIYETRPQICREYSTANCDYHSGDYNWSQHFTCADHIDDYLREHPPKPDRRRGRRAGRPGLRARLTGHGGYKPRESRVTSAVADTHGIPLPVLPFAAGE